MQNHLPKKFLVMLKQLSIFPTLENFKLKGYFVCNLPLKLLPECFIKPIILTSLMSAFFLVKY